MWNIFIALMSITLAFAFFDPNFFVAYLISIAVFGLFQAIYMANAGGAWDNAKKYVEVDLEGKGHAAARRHRRRRHGRRSVQGHDLGGPESDHQVLDPVRLAGGGNRRRNRKKPPTPRGTQDYTPVVGVVMLTIALIFVWRSFYAMRIPQKPGAAH